MPSFLSRVFGRKKDDTKEVGNRRPSSDASLLEGKFEAVPPTISPIASRFDGSTDASAIQDKEKEKDGFGLFRPKSRVSPSWSISVYGNPKGSGLSPVLEPPRSERGGHSGAWCSV